jgi:hypothetical protein
MSARRQLYVCTSCCTVRAIDRPLQSVNGTAMTHTLDVICDFPVNAYGKTCKGKLVPLTLGDFLTAAELGEAQRAASGNEK